MIVQVPGENSSELYERVSNKAGIPYHASIDIYLEVLVTSGENSVGATLWLLQGLAMGAQGEILADMYVLLELGDMYVLLELGGIYRSGSDVVHHIPEVCNKCRWIGWCVGCGLLEEITQQAESSTIHQFCCTAG